MEMLSTQHQNGLFSPKNGNGLKAGLARKPYSEESIGRLSGWLAANMLRLVSFLDQQDLASLSQVHRTFKKVAQHEMALRIFFSPRTFDIRSSIVIEKSRYTIDKIWAVPGKEKSFMISSVPPPEQEIISYNMETQDSISIALSIGKPGVDLNVIGVDKRAPFLLFRQGESKELILFNYQSNKIVERLPCSSFQMIRSFAAYQGDELIVALGMPQGLAIWNVSRNTINRYGEAEITALCVTEYQERPCFACYADDNRLHLIDAQNGEELLSFQDPIQAVHDKKMVKKMRTQSEELYPGLPQYKPSIAIHLRETTFFGDKQVALVRKDGSIERWNPATRRCEAKVSKVDQPFCVVDFECIKICNTEIWVSIEPTFVKLWDPYTLKLIAKVSLYDFCSDPTKRSGVILRSIMASQEELRLYIATDHAVYRWDLS